MLNPTFDLSSIWEKKVWVANTYVVNYVFSAGFKAQLIKLIDVGMKKPKQPSNNHL